MLFEIGKLGVECTNVENHFHFSNFIYNFRTKDESFIFNLFQLVSIHCDWYYSICTFGKLFFLSPSENLFHDRNIYINYLLYQRLRSLCQMYIVFLWKTKNTKNDLHKNVSRFPEIFFTLNLWFCWSLRWFFMQRYILIFKTGEQILIGKSSLLFINRRLYTLYILWREKKSFIYISVHGHWHSVSTLTVLTQCQYGPYSNIIFHGHYHSKRHSNMA